MASSSVSQESLDHEDFEPNRRVVRPRRSRGPMYRSGDRDGWGDAAGERDGSREQNGDYGIEEGQGGYGAIPEHDSPTRVSAVSRAKDKRRPNHLHKGKPPKDKRKLREKRRSTGVVHLASTESTGDSLDDDEEEDKILSEAKRNMAYNEVIDADNPQTPSEVPRGFGVNRNKSPSDLEADLEDNQDYDSAVSQSDTNLTLIDSSEHTTTTAREQQPPRNAYYNKGSAPSRYTLGSSEQVRQARLSSNTSDQDSKTPLSSTSSSSSSLSSSVLTRYPYVNRDSKPSEPLSPKSKAEIIRPVASILARYQERAQQETELQSQSYQRLRNREQGVRGSLGPITTSPLLNKEKDDEKAKLEKLLEKEREENKRLKKALDDKERRIAELEREMAILNKQ
ncbi:hypothetical protein CHS0354_002562 [Potamilus streckersoni]|uniref:Uncharacterized protein n=1 Tax=Potamilus streckersoni TaxID=2493646 RepID=A0AAE0WB90_9BIVA|nr:hypothetical protein CHS0354_002562 [Potamilus streckersoni]